MIVNLLDKAKQVSLFGRTLTAASPSITVSKTALLNSSRVSGPSTSSDLTDLETLFKAGVVGVIDGGVPVTSFADLEFILNNGYPPGGTGTDATSIRTVPVDPTLPTPGQVLSFDGLKYTPVTFTSSGTANAMAYFNGAGAMTSSANLIIGLFDPFGRPQIHDKRTNAGRFAVWRQGSWGMDGDPDNVKSEGVVLYGCNSLGNGPDGSQGGMFFATTGSVGVGQIIPAVNGGNMFYAFGFENASPDNPGFGPANKFVINDDTNARVFEVDRIAKVLAINSNLTMGSIDVYGRPQIWDIRTQAGTGAVWRQGSWQVDGDPTNVQGEGIVVYGKDPVSGLQDGSNGAFARIKCDRFAIRQITGGVDLGYGFRVDLTEMYFKDNTGAETCNIARTTGLAWFKELHIGSSGGPRILTGAGSPEGAVVGSPGDLYLSTTGGASTTLYVKESGSGTNTGWAGK